MRLKSDLPAALKFQALVVENAAREAGLDFFEVVFELLDSINVNGVAAYGGFPIRYPSWRFGMEYERLEKGRRWGLSKIYELVINNDPTYAYLVRSNSLLEQKLVMAHVYGHADFFKHNLWFAPSDRKMLDTMANHAIRIRRYIDAFGLEQVERFIDLCLSIDTLIDPYLPLREYSNPAENRSAYTPASERALRSLEALSSSPLAEPASEVEIRPKARALPTYDVLGFVEESARLEAWQRDVLNIVRTEAYYFAPQRMTKIMNEGWASFWHSRLLTAGIVDPSEILDFADCHSSATMSGPGQINPYKLGIELFRHADTIGEDIFQLRRVHNDVSLIHKLVDEEFALRHILPLHVLPAAPTGAGGAAEPVDWRRLKTWLLQQLAWGGLPQIELVDVDAGSEQEMLLVHHHDGRDLQIGRAAETLRQLETIWQRPVHLLTVLEKQGKRLMVREGKFEMVDNNEAGRVCATESEEQEAVDPQEGAA
jgi:stage V sporulation protein R